MILSAERETRTEGQTPESRGWGLNSNLLTCVWHLTSFLNGCRHAVPSWDRTLPPQWAPQLL